MAKKSSGKVKLNCVYVAAGHLEASVIKSRLESEGIPVLLKYEGIGKVYGITVDGLSQVKVMVPDAMAEEARDIVRVPGQGI